MNYLRHAAQEFLPRFQKYLVTYAILLINFRVEFLSGSFKNMHEMTPCARDDRTCKGLYNKKMEIRQLL